jgi:hypothetical protein
MTERLDKEKLLQFLRELGKAAKTQGTCYLTGGATAILLGWRETTIDVDIKLEPEPQGVFDSISELKKRLGINVELAAPDDFIPPLDGWRERSLIVGQFGNVTVYHYDLISQALAKLERGHDKDLYDVARMLELGLVSKRELKRHLEAIRPALKRYPAIDEEAFVRKVLEFLDKRQDG